MNDILGTFDVVMWLMSEVIFGHSMYIYENDGLGGSSTGFFHYFSIISHASELQVERQGL